MFCEGICIPKIAQKQDAAEALPDKITLVFLNCFSSGSNFSDGFWSASEITTFHPYYSSFPS